MTDLIWNDLITFVFLHKEMKQRPKHTVKHTLPRIQAVFRKFMMILVFLTVISSMGKGQDAETLFNRAIVKIELNSWDDALEDLNAVIKLDPDHKDAFYFRGVAKYFMGNYDHAEKDFNMQLKLDPTHVRSYYFRGKCRAQLMEIFSSLADYKKVVTINPLNTTMFLYEAADNIF